MKGVSRKGYVKRLKAQQKALVNPARGGKKKHRKKIQEGYKTKKKRMKLYKSRVAHRVALITGKLKRTKPKRRRAK